MDVPTPHQTGIPAVFHEIFLTEFWICSKIVIFCIEPFYCALYIIYATVGAIRFAILYIYFLCTSKCIALGCAICLSKIYDRGCYVFIY